MSLRLQFALFGFFVVLGDFLAGAIAYNVRFWNWAHTAQLTGWEAFRTVSFVYGPIIIGCLIVGSGLLTLLVYSYVIATER